MSKFALIVEPDPALSAAQVSVVDALGLVPLVAAEGERAIWLLRRFGTPALLVTALSLPIVDGFELLDWLRAHANGRSTRVIVTSPFPELRMFAAALREHLGIGAIVPRSISPDALRSIAQELLETGTTSGSPSSEVVSSPPTGSVRSLMEAPEDARLGWFVRSTADELRSGAVMAVVGIDDGRAMVSSVGIEGRKWPLLASMGRHALGTGEMLVVADAFAHPFFQGDPAVSEGLVRGLAAAPIRDAAGQVRGLLCAIEPKARLRMGAEALSRLAERARQIGTAIPYLGQSQFRIVRASRRRIMETGPDSAPMSSQR